MITIRRIDTQEEKDVLGIFIEENTLWTVAGEGCLGDGLERTGEYEEDENWELWERVKLLPGWEIVSP